MGKFHNTVIRSLYSIIINQYKCSYANNKFRSNTLTGSARMRGLVGEKALTRNCSDGGAAARIFPSLFHNNSSRVLSEPLTSSNNLSFNVDL